jgi:hypothetical protein
MNKGVRTDLRTYVGNFAKVLITGPDGCVVSVEDVEWSQVPEIIRLWGKP